MKKRSTTIHVRIPSKLKRSVQEVAAANGLDLSSCIRMFLTHMDVRGIVPLPPLTVNGFTEKEEEEILRRAKGPFVPMKDIEDLFDSRKS